jgi:hypothetical protein
MKNHRPVIAFAAAVLFSVVNWVGYLSAAVTDAPTGSRDSLGVAYAPSAVDELGWIAIGQVEPGGAADAAGLRRGDSIKFETLGGTRAVWTAGEPVALEVDRGGRRFEVTLVAQNPHTDLVVRSFGLVLMAIQSLKRRNSVGTCDLRRAASSVPLKATSCGPG